MGTIKKIVHILSNIAYVAVLIYLLVSLPIFIGYKPLVVLSGSMEPTYKVGSIIYYEEKIDNIEAGDVIVFESGHASFVTHRVKEVVDKETYITKGDANDSEDPEPVKLQSIKGKVIKLNIPWLGYYIQYVNTNVGLVVVIVFILVSEFLLSNMKSKKVEALDKEDALEGGSKDER